MTPEREAIRRHSKSFALAARLLAPAPRRRAERLYAWCRAADDAVDLADTPAAAAEALAAVRRDLDAVYACRTPAAPEAVLLAEVVAECRLPRDYPDELLAGMAMDVAGQRYQTFDELLVYCHRAAGVVGLMMCHALGVADDRACRQAAHLGIAMQLTNIARDVAEDWGRGRLYLPLDWLGGDPPAGKPLDDAAVAPVVRRLLDEADRYYTSGGEGLAALDRRGRLAVRVARSVYAAIGEGVRRHGCRPSAGRAVVPGWRKLTLVTLAAARSAADRPVGAVGPPASVWQHTPLPPLSPPDALDPEPTTMTARRSALEVVAFGFALVLVMAFVLFVLVGVNPKKAEYGNAPWVYAGVSAVGAVACWLASRRLARPVGPPVTGS